MLFQVFAELISNEILWLFPGISSIQGNLGEIQQAR